MKKLLLFLALGFCGLMAAPTYASTWYVDAANGYDHPTNCSNSATPCQDTNFVINNLVAGGDTVYLRGTFSRQLTVGAPQSGTASAYTTITTWPGEATAQINAAGYPAVFPIATGTSYIRIENLDLYGATSKGITTTPGSVSNIIMNRLKIHGLPSSAIVLNDGSTDITISNSIIYNNITDNGAAIDINNASNIYIYNNSFYNNNRSSGTGGACVSANSETNSIYIKNNIFSTADKGLSLSDKTYTISSNVYSDNNFFHNLTTTAVQVRGNNYSFSQWQSTYTQDLNSQETDPLFVSTTASSEDFHLQSTSPAIDAGTDLTAAGITTDYDNESRPYATAFDIGADELPIVTAPTLPVVSDTTTTTASISWTAPTTGITSYTLEYGTDSAYATVSSVTGLTAATHSFTGLTANTTYYYRIKALYNTYESSYLTDSFLTDPDKPTAFSATERKAKTMTVSWTPPAGTITEYAITYYDVDDTSNITELRTTDTTLQITDLNPNTEYHLACFALNGYSISESADFLVDRTLPAKVKNVKSLKKYLTASAAKIKWKKPANNTGLTYRVKLMTKKNKKIKIYKATKLSKLISKLTSNTTYKVKVRAKYDTDNKGAWSKVVKFRTLVN